MVPWGELTNGNRSSYVGRASGIVSRRETLKLLAGGACASSGVGIARTQERNYVDLLSVDPTNHPNVKVNFLVDTKAGRDGEITEENVKITESVGDQPPKKKSCTSFGFSSGSADIVFVFDDTGSMGEEIAAMKRGVKNLATEIESAGFDARYGLVTFKDSVEADQTLTDASTLKRKVDRLQAVEGGDAPEANFDAIEEALGFGFRTESLKVIIDITDSTSHYRGDGTEYSDYTMSEVETDLRNRGITFIGVAPDYDDPKSSIKTLTERVGGLWINIHDADFGKILDQITGLVKTTYHCQYRSDTPSKASRNAGNVKCRVDDPQHPPDTDEKTISVPETVKEPATILKPNGEPAVNDNIAVFFAEENEQLTSQNTDEQGKVNFEIPIENTQDELSVQYYQIYDKNEDTVEIELPLPDDRPSASVAGKTDGCPDLYAIRRIKASESQGVTEQRLPEAYKLDVRVEDSSGAPVEDARVSVFHIANDTNAGFVGSTRSDGRFEISEGDDTGIEVQGEVLVVAQSSDGTRQERRLTVNSAQSITITV